MVSSGKGSPWTEDEVVEFLEQYRARDSIFVQFRLPHALRLAWFHENVEFFTDHFASSILGESQIPSEASHALSWNERHRIGRNLYRFEVYCNLFKDDGKCPAGFSSQLQQKIF